jgi:hypothetical protein
MFLSFEAKAQPEMELSVKESIREIIFIFFKVVFFLIVTVAVYVGGVLLLFNPMSYIQFDWFFTWIGLCVVLIFDVLFVVVMILFPFENSRLRKILIWLTLTISGSISTCWRGLSLLADFTW